MADVFETFRESFSSRRSVEMSLQEYLEGCRNDPGMYANAAERMLAAIGEPMLLDTSRDARLGRIFQNRAIKVYPYFKDFFGME